MGGNLEEMGNKLFYKTLVSSRKSVNMLRASLCPA